MDPARPDSPPPGRESLAREEGEPLRGRPPGARFSLKRLRAVLAATAPVLAPSCGRPPQEGGPTRVWEERFGGEAGFPAALFGEWFAREAAREPRPSFLLERTGHDTVFWDLETCGLADDPVFLLGALVAGGPVMRLVRVLALDPAGEPALVRRAVELLGPEAVWVTFNGRSFDAPRLRRRASRHGLELPAPREHHDLLHLVRRRFRGQLPDCRLSTVERRLLGLDRAPGDVPGREVPERYRDFVRTGEMRWVEPVLEHNRRDVAAIAVLFHRLWGEGLVQSSRQSTVDS